MTGAAVTGGRVLVLGSINVDLIARVRRLPVAGETVIADDILRALGGKGANEAVAAARADAPTVMLGATGRDEEGVAMVGALAGHGVNVAAVARVDATTGYAMVVTSPADNQIVVIPGANLLVDTAVAAGAVVDGRDICLTQLEIPVATALDFFSRARAAGAITILNAAPASEDASPLLPLTDILVVNENELGCSEDLRKGDFQGGVEMIQG